MRVQLGLHWNSKYCSYIGTQQPCGATMQNNIAVVSKRMNPWHRQLMVRGAVVISSSSCYQPGGLALTDQQRLQLCWPLGALDSCALLVALQSNHQPYGTTVQNLVDDESRCPTLVLLT